MWVDVNRPDIATLFWKLPSASFLLDERLSDTPYAMPGGCTLPDGGYVSSVALPHGSRSLSYRLPSCGGVAAISPLSAMRDAAVAASNCIYLTSAKAFRPKSIGIAW